MEILLIDKWDLRFLKLADHVSKWSKDPSTQVGAVIVDPKRRVVGMGYNGFPRGVHDLPERLEDRPLKLDLVVHAEVNAILNAVASTENCTLYVKGLFTCVRCAGIVIQSGIKRVVAVSRDSANIDWALSSNRAKAMYDEAGVSHVIYTMEVLSE